VPELCPEGQAKYQRVVAFFEQILRHSKGQNAGKPFISVAVAASRHA
jgi:hypothetical protein